MRSRCTSLVLDLAYSIALIVLVPWLLFLWLGRRRGLGSLSERLGASPRLDAGRRRVWLHAVSVGELEVALSLVTELQAADPELDVVVSTTTTTAQQVARRRRPDLTVFLLPVDLGVCTRRSLRRVSPTVLVLVELELWPNLVLNAKARGVPIVVVNGRISERGHRRMRRVRFALTPFLRRVDRWLVQNSEYAARLRDLGVDAGRIREVGNLKFDRAPLPDTGTCRCDFERTWGYPPGAVRWIAGCTHPGEEAMVLDVHRDLQAKFPELTLLIAPRHVERASEVVEASAQRGFTVGRSSRPPDGAEGGAPGVVVVDETGLLLRLYACADVAFVGGSLVPRGGHNVLEPLLAGTPVVHGPEMANFREVVERFEGSGALRQVPNAAELGAEVGRLLGDSVERANRVRGGHATLEQHRGAARVTTAEILERVAGPGTP